MPTHRFPRALLLSLAFTAPLLAQNGDHRGEVQAPLRADLKVPPAPALSPAEALKTFKLAPGFRLEAVAADPLVGDPVSIQFGPDGRLWVLEMRGFMPNVDGTGERDPVGDVAVLEDTDGDGRFDKRTVFLDQLVLPRAISLVGDGILIAEPMRLWFCRDTNGDGVCDEKTEVAADYGNINNPEHNANGLMWAMDNWIYSANFIARFRYEGGGKFSRDATITRGQWGISQDDTGRIYYNSNSDPLRVDFVPAPYLKRNPNFGAAGANVQLVPASLKVNPGRVTPGINRGYNTLNAESKEYAVTSACGPVVYRGTLFPEEFRGDAFIAEPSGNLVKRIKLTEKDGALLGANAYEGTEFLTSTDERFRPVNLFNGPDGALYVVDMYRGVIQHRLYVTSFLRKQIEERKLEQPRALGRIWRIVPEGAPAADFKSLTLAKATTTELIAKLGDANGWTRDTAQRLLVERRDASGVRELTATAADPQKPALARLHALWTLEGLKALDRSTVLVALTDRDAHVCAAAIRLAENFFKQSDGAALVGRIAAMTRTEPAVRLQLALTLGGAGTKAADSALLGLIVEAGRQPYLADAVLSGLAGREADFVEALVKEPAAAARGVEALRFASSAVLKSGRAADIDRVLAVAANEATPAWARSAVLSGVRLFLPKAPDGKKVFPGSLPAEPKPLVALANTESTAGATAKQLLAQLKWPGKAGAAEVVVRPLTAPEQALFDKGKAQFAALCASCHQPNGQGLAGLAPSLLYSRWVLGDPRILARIVLCGKVQDNLSMPPWKAALDDEAIAGVLTFVRRSWGHDAEPIAPAIIADARKETVKREEPWSDADLEDLVQSFTPVKK